VKRPIAKGFTPNSTLTCAVALIITAFMSSPMRLGRAIILSLALLFWGRCAAGETFRVATYNLEGYLAESTGTRPAKSAQAKAKIRESIRALKPDVLALQEMGGTNALLELRDSLKAEGLDLPYWEHIAGFDTNIHAAVLSKFPFTGRRPHTDESFLLSGRRYRVSRGFAEVDIQVNPNYSFTLITAHLKSKRAVVQADEAELRLEEAKLLREIVDARLNAKPEANLVVLGDFNDTKDSASTKAVIGRGKRKLLDTRPAERNGDNVPAADPAREPRNVSWTHYYGKEDSFSRIDYILISPGMAREWVTNETYVLSLPNWGVGSDHRPIVAAFEAEDK
jgi:endonuclease/exonuclease/phosphatase family metal-dependent hydrolase